MEIRIWGLFVIGYQRITRTKESGPFRSNFECKGPVDSIQNLLLMPKPFQCHDAIWFHFSLSRPSVIQPPADLNQPPHTGSHLENRRVSTLDGFHIFVIDLEGESTPKKQPDLRDVKKEFPEDVISAHDDSRSARVHSPTSLCPEENPLDPFPSREASETPPGACPASGSPVFTTKAVSRSISPRDQVREQTPLAESCSVPRVAATPPPDSLHADKLHHRRQSSSMSKTYLDLPIPASSTGEMSTDVPLMPLRRRHSTVTPPNKYSLSQFPGPVTRRRLGSDSTQPISNSSCSSTHQIADTLPTDEMRRRFSSFGCELLHSNNDAAPHVISRKPRSVSCGTNPSYGRSSVCTLSSSGNSSGLETSQLLFTGGHSISEESLAPAEDMPVRRYRFLRLPQVHWYSRNLNTDVETEV